MNPHTNTPPSPTDAANRSDDNSFIIVVRVLIPVCALPLAYSFPSVSYLPMRMLDEAAKLDLLSHEITALTNGLGTLNTGLLTLKVSDVHAALPHVLNLLKRLELLQWSAVYWYDAREDFLRPLHIGEAIAPQPHFGIEELNAQSAAYKKEIADAQSFAQFFLAKYAPKLLPPADPPAPGQT